MATGNNWTVAEPSYFSVKRDYVKGMHKVIDLDCFGWIVTSIRLI